MKHSGKQILFPSMPFTEKLVKYVVGLLVAFTTILCAIIYISLFLLTMKQNNNKMQYIMHCKNYSKTKTITFLSI